MIQQVKQKRPAIRSKLNKTVDNKRSNVANNTREIETFDPNIKMGKFAKSVSENLPRSLDHPSNHCTLENCQSNSLVYSQCPFVQTDKNFEQTWDINGNLKNSVDHSVFYENFEKNAILPPFNAYLNRGRHQKSFDDEKFRNQDGVQIFTTSLPNSHNMFDKYVIDCPLKCRLHGKSSSNFDSLFTNDFSSMDRNGSNTLDDLGSKFSGALSIAGQNDDANCNNYKQRGAYCVQQQTPVGSNVNVPVFPGLQTVDNANSTNLPPYANYYQNVAFNSREQNVQLLGQTQGQFNVQNVRPILHQGFNYEHYPQQFLSNNVKPVVGQQIGWCAAQSLPNRYYNGIPSHLNNWSNYQTMVRSQNAQEACYKDRINDWSRFNRSMIGSNDVFAQKNFVKPTMNPETAILAQNQQQYEGNTYGNAKYNMRPILKGGNANVRVSY
ncbi:uncharacterized protein LOC143342103 [Colletes latitarsis]|uniref:uncharacterized protein LOC143342103 n=1 Tax=Colletes latitarsis TaxID=2605962 RepID=UPI0040355C48